MLAAQIFSERHKTSMATRLENAASVPTTGLVKFYDHNQIETRAYAFSTTTEPHIYCADRIKAYVCDEGRYVLLHHAEGGTALIRRPHGATRIHVVETEGAVYAGFINDSNPNVVAGEIEGNFFVLDERRLRKWCRMNNLRFDQETMIVGSAEKVNVAPTKKKKNRKNRMRVRHA